MQHTGCGKANSRWPNWAGGLRRLVFASLSLPTTHVAHQDHLLSTSCLCLHLLLVPPCEDKPPPPAVSSGPLTFSFPTACAAHLDCLLPSCASASISYLDRESTHLCCMGYTAPESIGQGTSGIQLLLDTIGLHALATSCACAGDGSPSQAVHPEIVFPQNKP